MAKASPSANRPKAAKAARDAGTHAATGRAAVAGAPKPTAASKAERTLASRLLRDIREKAGDLSMSADRLLRRVS